MGHVSAVDLERLRPVLAGDAVTALGPFPVVLGRTDDQFVVLQHDRRTVRLRWRGEGPLTLSRANELLHEQQRSSSSGVTSLGSGFVASPTTPTVRRPSAGPGTLMGSGAGAGNDGDDDDDDEDTVPVAHALFFLVANVLLDSFLHHCRHMHGRRWVRAAGRIAAAANPGPPRAPAHTRHRVPALDIRR